MKFYQILYLDYLNGIIIIGTIIEQCKFYDTIFDYDI